MFLCFCPFLTLLPNSIYFATLDLFLLTCSKSAFLIYKLKEIGKILENDLAAICDQFDPLDSEKSGKATFSHYWNLETKEIVNFKWLFDSNRKAFSYPTLKSLVCK